MAMNIVPGRVRDGRVVVWSVLR